MDKLPFSVYDFFAYLASGFVLLIGLAAAFSGTADWQESPTTIVGLLLIVLAYVSGHIVANLSAYLLERTIVRGHLGMPSEVLFGVGPPESWAKVFPGYASALPDKQRERVLERARREAGIEEPGEALFWHCFARVKDSQEVQGRLNTFLNLYGFCRNMALALLVVGLALIAGTVIGSAHTGDVVPAGWWAAGAIGGSIAMFYRYVKFLRHYGLEVFTSYAELEPSEAPHGSN